MSDATLTPGWHTDLAVAKLSGSEVEERTDHLVVRSPHNPTYHWGNYLLVTGPASVDDAERWTSVFAATFPDAAYVAIGMVAEPAHEPWDAVGLEIETEDVLESLALLERRPCPEGYGARELTTDDDWRQQVALHLRDNDESGEQDPVTYSLFVERTAEANRGLAARGIGAWFGAFAGDELVADLGIVDCGELAGRRSARYRSVGTHADHRRRGLAGHLIGVAGSWAADVRGCGRWVILTESDNPAGRLYRSLGFSETTPNAQAYRPPPRS